MRFKDIWWTSDVSEFHTVWLLIENARARNLGEVSGTLHNRFSHFCRAHCRDLWPTDRQTHTDRTSKVVIGHSTCCRHWRDIIRYCAAEQSTCTKICLARSTHLFMLSQAKLSCTNFCWLLSVILETKRLLYKLKAHINICINGHLLTTLLCLDNQFLLHDAMLAWYMLSSCVCVWVHLSVTSRYCIETTGRIELVFGMDASSTDPMLQK